MQNDTEALVDLTSLRNLLNDRSESIIEFLNIFIVDIPFTITEMREFLDKQDWANLIDRIHAIKPHYEYVGSKQLFQKLSDWEMNLEKGVHIEMGYDRMTELEQNTKSIIVQLQQIVYEEARK